MKKMLFSAIAMIAFTGSAFAQLSPEASLNLSDTIHCSIMAGFHVGEKLRDNPNLTEAEQKLIRDSYRTGCVEARRAVRLENTVETTVSIKKN